MTDHISSDGREFGARATAVLDELAREHGWTKEPEQRRRIAAEHGEGAIANAKLCQRLLFEHGLAGLSWPIEYGGQGLGLREEILFTLAARRYELPVAMFVIGLGMCGPTVLAVGSEVQRSRYLAPMLSGDEVWCQMFSEPEAGSDVAGLRTRAVRDGDEWVIDGQKTWTSGAHYSDFGILLARTDAGAPKHRGLTMFILDLRLPGITVRPIHQIDGRTHFNEVFLDGVRIPADSVLGSVGGGWSAATTTLANERVALGAIRPLDDVASARSLIDRAQTTGRSLDPVVRQQLAAVWMNERLVGLLGERITSAILAGATPGPEGSVAKLVRTEFSRQSAALDAALAGPSALAWQPGAEPADHEATTLLYVTALSIAGGTDEVLRSVIGERVLGLPKEPQVDKGIPFRELAKGAR